MEHEMQKLIKLDAWNWDESEEAKTVRESAYGKQASPFAAGQCPAYRCHTALKVCISPTAILEPCAADDVPLGEDSTDRWEASFAADLGQFASEMFAHICDIVFIVI